MTDNDSKPKRYITSEAVGLKFDPPRTAASARTFLKRAGIRAIRGYDETKVDELIEKHNSKPNKGKQQ